MAVTVTGGSTIRSAAGTSLSFGLDVGSSPNRALHVSCKAFAAANPVTGVTYAGEALSANGTTAHQHFCRATAATGNNNVVLTYSGYERSHSWTVAFSGCDQTTPFGSVTNNSGWSSSPATSTITCPANGVALGCCDHGYTAGTLNITTGTHISSYAGYGLAAGYRTSTGTVEWSAGSSYGWDAWGLEVFPAEAAMPTRPLTILDAVHRASNW